MSSARIYNGKNYTLENMQHTGQSLNTLSMQGPGKKWEHYELNKNGKPLIKPMHVQRGDFVQIISGSDKGKTGKIIKVESQHRKPA